MKFEKGNIPWTKGKKLSAEHKKKIADALRGKIGKKHTEETKKKMSETMKGNKNPFWGKSHSEETKRKISKNNLSFYVKNQ